jgi:aarF domain-containing kinase
MFRCQRSLDTNTGPRSPCFLPHDLCAESPFSLLWRSLFVFDTKAIDASGNIRSSQFRPANLTYRLQRVAKEWGIADSNLFASATLLRPFKVHKSDGKKPPSEPKEVQADLKERLRNMLSNEQLIPRVFISICLVFFSPQAN